YLTDFKVEELPGLTIDYADTVAYFGVGLGQSFPRWKANLNLDWKFSDGITWSNRVRHIDGMKNRASVQFLGEEFTGTSSITYFDTAVGFNVDKITFRVGVNNLFNTGPRTYRPNVQSGTDPSLYDVVGRRGFASVRLRY
ncbi:MAG TPA: TonB-dependent receptor, partial [Novosphingobium sp.]|nr:TonB-dependent receptor [Novosphingobium sp.]